MAKNYSLLKSKGIKKYKPLRTSSVKNDILVIMGPVGYFKPNLSEKNRRVGDYTMYYVITYKKDRNNQWVYGDTKALINRVAVAKTFSEAKKKAKAIYYVKKGTMAAVGKAVRKEYDLNQSN